MNKLIRTLPAIAALVAFAPGLAVATDSDGDGIDDLVDLFPDSANVGVALLDGKRTVRTDGIDKVRSDVDLAIHFAADGRFALCEASCRFGKYKKDSRRKYRLKLAKADRKAVAVETEFAIESELFQARGLIHDIDFAWDGKPKMAIKVSKNGKRLALEALYHHRAKIVEPKPRERVDGKMRLAASGPFSGFSDPP